MRLKRVFPAAALILALAAGLALYVGPCCGARGTAGSALSIGTAPCCGADGPGSCGATMQRADDFGAAPGAPSLPPLALHGGAVAAPSLSSLFNVLSPSRPTLPRPDLARLAVPLLI